MSQWYFAQNLVNHALKRMSWVHSIRIQGVQETSIQLKYLPRNIIETSSGWKNVEWKLNWHDHPIGPVFNDNALIVICWKRFIEVWRISTNGICELTAFSVPKLIQKRSRKTTVTHKQIEKISGDFASMRSPHANGLKWTLDGYQWKITKNALQSHC